MQASFVSHVATEEEGRQAGSVDRDSVFEDGAKVFEGDGEEADCDNSTYNVQLYRTLRK